MIIQLANVLSADVAKRICDTVSDDALWIDGADSAEGRARKVKSNLQANPEDETIRETLKEIQRTLANNKLFIAAARPADMARIMLNRYDVSMSYGAHADAAYMYNVRTDVSFTLFLSPPDQYEGGELVIENPGGIDTIKLPAGGLVLYPSSSIHKVNEVARGSRIAAVGWVKSRVRSPEKRAILFEVERALSELLPYEVTGATQDRLGNLRNNLLRLWGE